MTRLREALDRAGALLPGPAAPEHDGAAELAGPWQLEAAAEATRVDAPRRAPERLEDRQLADGTPLPKVSVQADANRREATEPPADLPPVTERLSQGEKLVVLPDADVTLVEQFRRLAAALHHAQTQNGTRTVMVASAVEGEGKTLTATNLALTLSESYQKRVLLIDADLRRPSVHQRFHLDNRVGLSDTLKHVIDDGAMPVHRVSRNLWVITGGPPDPDPMSGLVSDTMRQLLAEAMEQFDWVVVDTPPVVLLPDANLLAAMIDTALLVVRANSTPYPLSQRAVEAIGKERILGIVLNRAVQSALSDGGYYYSSYRYSYGHDRRRDRSLMSRLRFWRKSKR